MLSSSDLLHACNIVINPNKRYKIHLAVNSKSGSPIQQFYKGSFNDWQSHQTQKNFECDYVISLIRIGRDRWLFVGVYGVSGRKRLKDSKMWYYDLNLVEGQEPLIGRAVLAYKRTGRASYIWKKELANEMAMLEYLPQRMTIESYPGHHCVCISYSELNLIIDQKEKTWYGALANIKGIYCITDITNGKQYVGKADGEDGIWQRWSTYVNNGHGDNKALRHLLKEKGLDYKVNFQFSLLEVADFKTPDAEVGQRESHWKNVLRSRDFGYNEN
ncbi:MAG: GIY-YIG nuclease family protein [Cryomorphaceae bacterium]|nr:MAG: GIY-YIG nuclease family protein [Cryomorphaceae bacterium]